MTVGERNFTPEERAAGLLFRLRDSLKSRDRVERGGATLQGSGTTFSASGMTLDGNGNLLYNVVGSRVLRAALTFVFEFTITALGKSQEFFSLATGSGGGLCRVGLGVSDALTVTMGGTAVLSVAYAAWSPYYNAGARNTLIITTTTGATTMWLNGTSVGTSATAWTPSYATTLLALGATYANTTRFTGTIHRFEIYGFAATAVDEPYLRNGNLIQKLDEPLIVLPGTSAWRDTTDSNKYKTEVRGKAGITSALLGSTGLVTTEFPSIIKPRGFSFDGGDQITIADADALSFTSGGGVDLPFSIAFIQQRTGALGGTRGFLAKGSWTSGLEYAAWLEDSLPNTLVKFACFTDNTKYIGRSAQVTAGDGSFIVWVFTYDGSKAVGGFCIYRNGVRVDNANISVGSYAGMVNGAANLTFGMFSGAVSSFIGNQVLQQFHGIALSPLQVKALTARLRYQARRG